MKLAKMVTKPNFGFGTFFILRHFSKYALKTPKNDPKKVIFSICSLLEGISEKVAENRPPIIKI